MEPSDTEPTQVAKDVIARQDVLIVIFEQIENFFKRLEKHDDVPMTEAVKDIMVKIMAELLEIFAIITKEIKQGRSSESIPDDMSPVADRGSETLNKIFKILIGSKGIEDALRRLDRLTQDAVEIMKAAGTEEEKRSYSSSLASLGAET